jgi:hypothetical protein
LDLVGPVALIVVIIQLTGAKAVHGREELGHQFSYLAHVSNAHPRVFCMLLGKVLPAQPEPVGSRSRSSSRYCQRSNPSGSRRSTARIKLTIVNIPAQPGELPPFGEGFYFVALKFWSSHVVNLAEVRDHFFNELG